MTQNLCQENPERPEFGCLAHPFRLISMSEWAVVGSFTSPNYSGGGVLEWAESEEVAKVRAEVLNGCNFTEEVGPYDMNEGE